MLNRSVEIRCLVALCTIGLFLIQGALSASANTNAMPDRQALQGDVVVWGNTDLAGGTAYTFDFGDGSPVVNGLVSASSQSYIATTHTYAAGVYTATLTVGAEVASAMITVVDPSTLTASELEDAQVNSAIEDGLRYLYFAADTREARHDAGWNLVSWSSHIAFTSMATLAFENHGYTTTSGDIYSPVVQAGLNYIFSTLVNQALTVEPAGDPCVPGVLPAGTFCNGLAANNTAGYATGVALLALAGSGTPGAVVTTGVATGQSYSEVAQRLVNTIAWGQSDSGFGQGGWRYSLDADSDGSAIGWNVLGLLDAQAFGAILPTAASGYLDLVGQLEFEIASLTGTGSNGAPLGSLGYTAPLLGTSRAGVRLQALHMIGTALNAVPPSGPAGVTPQDTVDYINLKWGGNNSCFYQNEGNKGCMYTMFNTFKGLKLYGVTTLPNATHGSPDDDDWYAEYEGYLTAGQVSPTSTSGGSWANEHFSHTGDNTNAETALALLILSKSATILPDDITFSLTNQAVQIGGTATITALATTTSGAPVPGVSVDFDIVSGPHAGLTGLTDVTDANGEAIVQYVGTASGTDEIVASAGPVVSNPAFVIWFKTCDADGDLDIDNTDVSLILAARNTPSTGPGDPRDADGDGVITVLDARICVLMRGQ